MVGQILDGCLLGPLVAIPSLGFSASFEGKTFLHLAT